MEPQLRAEAGEAFVQVSLIAASLITTAWWMFLELQAARTPGKSVPLVLTAIALAASLIFIISENVKPAEAAMSIAVMAAAVTGVCCLLPQVSMSRGAMLVFSLPLVILFVFVRWYSYNQPAPASLALLAAAPAMLFIADVPLIRRRPRLRNVLWYLLPLMTLSAAVAVAALEKAESGG